MTLQQLLHIEEKKPCTIAICGAGGKTTLLFALAREAAASGRRTAIYTTTHIMRPEEQEDLAIFGALSPAAISAAWQAGKAAVFGTQAPNGRLGIPAPEVLNFLKSNADLCAVEADGANRLPCKFPNLEYEPVLPQQTTHIIVVFGLNAVGKPLDTYCHRAVLARKCLQTSAEIIDEALMAQLIIKGYGHLHPIVLLNQADDPRRLACGEKIAGILRQNAKIQHVCIASLHRIIYKNAQNHE